MTVPNWTFTAPKEILTVPDSVARFGKDLATFHMMLAILAILAIFS